jgi:signal peptidase I
MKQEWTAPKEVTTNPRGKKNEILELIRFTLITLLIVIPIRMFIAQPFIVNGESMLPTFENGDYLIIDEVSYRTTEPERGEVVVFRYPGDDKRFLIKRIIALPGEQISISGDTINIKDVDGNDVQLDESYIRTDFSSYGTWQLEDEEYFVMGDNRNASSDSRSWGVLKRDRIVGKTFLRLFPFSGIGLHPGEVEAIDIERVSE